MADIKIVCGKCGAENTFSEYSRAESRICTKCGESLKSESKLEKSRLKVRNLDGDDGKTTLGGAPLEAVGSKKKKETVEAGEEKRKPQKKTKQSASSSILLGLFVFLLFGGLLVAGQYFGRDDAGIMKIYLNVRLFALGLAFAIVVIDAFHEGQIPGFLALLIPPYLVYYALARLDSFWRQGIFFAVVIMLGTELVYVRNESILLYCDNFIANQIDFVSDQLDKAGNEPLPEL